MGCEAIPGGLDGHQRQSGGNAAPGGAGSQATTGNDPGSELSGGRGLSFHLSAAPRSLPPISTIRWGWAVRQTLGGLTHVPITVRLR